MNEATVIGAGLAGCEAAWQLASRGISTTIVEMKPEHRSPAHRTDGFAELVCSNSLRGDQLSNAVGLLKQEMRELGSLIMEAADRTRIPAGGALAVDREGFSRYITDKIIHHPRITVVHREENTIPSGPCIIATGPLTSDPMAKAVASLSGLETLHFFDAAAPIVSRESLDMSRVFRQSRYQKGDDYLNCPMDREQYFSFVRELISAETAEIHGFEENLTFEGCMPIESMAKRGEMVPAFGPMKPVGLIDPSTGKEPFAVVQLRQDDAGDSLYNIVGFQTRLKFGEQRRVFGMIPGLENAEFARYGVMHRNTFISSPGFLNSSFEVISRDNLYFAGQITGVEGYIESAASGLVAGMSLARSLRGKERLKLPGCTALGALGRYVSTPNRNFQPMNCTFGIIDPLPRIPGQRKPKDKKSRYEAVADRALKTLREIIDQNQEDFLNVRTV